MRQPDDAHKHTPRPDTITALRHALRQYCQERLDSGQIFSIASARDRVYLWLFYEQYRRLQAGAIEFASIGRIIMTNWPSQFGCLKQLPCGWTNEHRVVTMVGFRLALAFRGQPLIVC